LLAYTQYGRPVMGMTGAEKPGSPTTVAAGGVNIGVPAMIPQLGDSFLDRIVDMATRSEDVKFRQDFAERIATAALEAVDLSTELQVYQDMLKTIVSPAPPPPEITPEQRAADVKTIKERLSGVYAELVATTAHIQIIYEQLSGRNLNPQSELYSAPEPMGVQGELSLRRKAGYFAMLVIVAMLAVAAVCLLHARLMSGKAASGESSFSADSAESD